MRQFKLISASLAILTAGAVAVAAVRPAALFPQEMPMPTEEHKMIHKGIGEWEGTLTMHMTGMSEDPVPATETVEAFGPFWTVSHFHCDFGMMKYEGLGTAGYDPVKKKYISTWQHNTSHELMVMEGEMAEDGSITYHYESLSYETGKMTPHHNVLKFDEDSYEMDFYMGEGDAAKHTMNIKMQRKSDGDK